ncbi:MAG: hypothetical protein D3922_03415 [Candidatus Electrothrix sp. AR1]|nr:hypothetical protein [Candidatus Electrothrix sp. AR1]
MKKQSVNYKDVFALFYFLYIILLSIAIHFKGTPVGLYAELILLGPISRIHFIVLFFIVIVGLLSSETSTARAYPKKRKKNNAGPKPLTLLSRIGYFFMSIKMLLFGLLLFLAAFFILKDTFFGAVFMFLVSATLIFLSILGFKRAFSADKRNKLRIS